LKLINKKTIINILFILILFFSVSVFLFGISVTKNKGMILPFGIINITSGSMEPEIVTGDAIFIKKVNATSLKKDDIISFYYGNIIVTHKIINISNSLITTKGNSDTSLTEVISLNKVIGKYTGIKVNGFNKFVNFIKSFWGFMIFIVIPISCLFLFEAFDLFKNIKAKRENIKNDTEK